MTIILLLGNFLDVHAPNVSALTVLTDAPFIESISPSWNTGLRISRCPARGEFATFFGGH